MSQKTQRLALSVCFVITTALFGSAEAQTFADLMARAKAEAAAGNQSSPPGDNVLETVGSMLDLMPTATAAQLQDLYQLLEITRSDLPSTPSAAPQQTEPPQTEPQQTDASNTPAKPPAESTEPAVAAVPPPAAPPHPIVQSAAPVRPNPATASPGTASPATPNPVLSRSAEPDRSGRVARLTARGHDAEARGDFSGARRFYSSAAEQGDATAALNLGRLYDPAYLRQTAIGGVDADPDLARFWYQRAVTLGEAKAGPLLQALSMR
jgi:hypothetical protein